MDALDYNPDPELAERIRGGIAKHLDEVQHSLSAVLRRAVYVGQSASDGYASLGITQRCDVCRQLVVKTIPNGARFG